MIYIYHAVHKIFGCSFSRKNSLTAGSTYSFLLFPSDINADSWTYWCSIEISKVVFNQDWKILFHFLSFSFHSVCSIQNLLFGISNLVSKDILGHLQNMNFELRVYENWNGKCMQLYPPPSKCPGTFYPSDFPPGGLPNLQYRGSMPLFLCWPLNIKPIVLWTPNIVIYFWDP